VGVNSAWCILTNQISTAKFRSVQKILYCIHQTLLPRVLRVWGQWLGGGRPENRLVDAGEVLYCDGSSLLGSASGSWQDAVCMCQYGEVREDKGNEHLCYTSVFLRGVGGQCRDSLPPPRIIILYLLHECLVSNNPSESIEHYSRGNAWETPYEGMPCIHSGISYSGSWGISLGWYDRFVSNRKWQNLRAGYISGMSTVRFGTVSSIICSTGNYGTNHDRERSQVSGIMEYVHQDIEWVSVRMSQIQTDESNLLLYQLVAHLSLTNHLE